MKKPIYIKLVEDFVEADIPVALVEGKDDVPSSTLCKRIQLSINRMGYRGIIKARSIDSKPYLVNLTLIEEV